MSLKEFKLSSGAVLRVCEAPFEECLELNDVVMTELRVINFSFNGEVAAMITAAMLALAPSKRVRECLAVCMKHSLYNGARMTEDFWKTEKGKREDYFSVSRIVLEENLTPFLKSLYAEFISIASKLAVRPA